MLFVCSSISGSKHDRRSAKINVNFNCVAGSTNTLQVHSWPESLSDSTKTSVQKKDKHIVQEVNGLKKLQTTEGIAKVKQKCPVWADTHLGFLICSSANKGFSNTKIDASA